MSNPPVPRPASPPVDKAPPVHQQPQAPFSICEKATSMSYEAFWGAVRSTVRREIIRLAKGNENVDNVYTITALGEKMIDDLINAFETGKKVPGLSEKANGEGTCTMNWTALACFARWYVGRGLTGEQRDYVREQLALGVSGKDLMNDELVGANWYTCTGQEPEDEKDLCCPEYVVNDWYYKELQEGNVPSAKPSLGGTVLTVSLIGIGVFSVAMLLRLLSTVHPNPSTVPTTKGKSVEETLALERRLLREHASKRHSFEVWDETREYLTGQTTAAPTAAVEDLRELVDNIKATGKRTNADHELNWLLHLSAGRRLS